MIPLAVKNILGIKLHRLQYWKETPQKVWVLVLQKSELLNCLHVALLNNFVTNVGGKLINQTFALIYRQVIQIVIFQEFFDLHSDLIW